MSLQFVFGNSGSGKSHYLYQHIIEQSIRHPEKNFLVLVPEQFTMQTQKDLCTLHPRGGIMNIDVLSFGRLAHRIFEEVGGDHRQVLDDEGKNLILRKIAGAYEEELTVLRGNLRKQGYISEVKSVISEFTQYGVDFQRLDAFMETVNQDSYLYYKLQDVRKIYEKFEEYLQEKYITKEEMLDVLSGVVPVSRILRGSVVALDGFTGFTPVQNRLLGELLRVCDNVLVTVEMDGREDPFHDAHPYQLFGLSKEMTVSLVQTAREAGADVDEPVDLRIKTPGGAVERFRNNPAMAFLEQEMFRRSKRTFSGNPDAVSMFEAQNPRKEACYVAERIRALVRKEGYRYRDIAVIASDMNVYADVLEKACKEMDIPVFMDHKKSILLNSFVEYVRSLLAMGEQNLSYESVFRHLRTGLCGFTADETDRLENYVIALGIRGYRNWQKAWVRTTPLIGESELQQLNHMRVRFVEKIDPFMLVLKQRKKTVLDITEAVYEHVVRENLQERLSGMEQEFEHQGELALAKEYAQIYRITMELFDKFAELLGQESVTLKEYCDLLDAGLEEAKVGVIPPGLDQVMIGDVERTRIKNIRALFFVGANDTLLPGSPGSRGLLSERDREQFRKEEIALSPGPKEKLYIQKFYLYMNLTKPAEKLTVSWARVSGDGKTLRPAYLVAELRKLFPGVKIQAEESLEPGVRELTKKTGIRLLAEGFRERNRGLDNRWKELYSWFVRNGNNGELLEQIQKAGRSERTADRLGVETAGRLYPDKERVSVTRLELFASCAYAHFLQYGLRLTDREEYGFEAMDLGNVVHQALERFSRKTEEAGLDWRNIPDTVRDELIDESVEQSILDYGNTVLFSSARNEYMIRRIKHLIRRSVWGIGKQLEKGDFSPAGYELKFGGGKIDRIDTCEEDGKIYVRVTDYKTGFRAFDITAFYHGLQLQLPVYMNAAVTMEKQKHPEKEIVPAGLFYYRIQDPLVSEADSEEKVEESILKELRLDGIVNADEEAVSHLERDLSGASLCFPLRKNKDGSLSQNSHALQPREFETVLEYTREKERELKDRMYAGEIAAQPYELSGTTACDYCPGRDVCGFDIRIRGCTYRRLRKLSVPEAVENMEKNMERHRNSGKKDKEA